MTWWGKVVGGTFGFVIGGPLGAAFGAAVGHSFDRGLSGSSHTTSQTEQIQAAFFTATFSVLGCIAKVDGRVTESEIKLANAVMEDMLLDEDQKRVAKKLFGEGKRSDFDLNGVILQLKACCGRRRNLIRMFLEIQINAAWADGSYHPNEVSLLEQIGNQLGFDQEELRKLISMVGAKSQTRRTVQEDEISLGQAYAILGVSETTSDKDLKKAYRRLTSQHHPDKLVSKGLPEEMMKVATERTYEIRTAYEVIIKERKGKKG